MKYLNKEEFLKENEQMQLSATMYNTVEVLEWEPKEFLQNYEKWYEFNEKEMVSDCYGHATISCCEKVREMLLNLRFLYANEKGIPGPFEGVFPEARRPNIFGDEIAFVEKWNFSRANLNEKNRIMAITQVASICYQSPKSLGSESLYNRLAAESMGLPSSSFEFVPVLLDPWNSEAKKILEDQRSNVRKFGEWIKFINLETGKEQEALLTNYRAIYYDYETRVKLIREWYTGRVDSPENADALIEHEKVLKHLYLDFFNTEDECEIMARHFSVFLYKVDFPTRSQMVRHRANIQELSRRYVSGKRVPFEFYVSEKMKDITSEAGDTQKILDICLEHYYKALEDGVKPQEARRIIPQAGYTELWMAFQPTQLANYFRLRDDSHAQWEIHQTAIAMKEMIISLAALKDDMADPERQAEIARRIQRIKDGTCDIIGQEELEQMLGEREDEQDGKN